MIGHWPLGFLFFGCVLFRDDPVLGVSAVGHTGELCGISYPKGLDGYKFHGSVPERGQFPWVTALFDNNKYFGVGSLIAPGLVLTAGHLVCNKSETDVVVRAGICNWSPNSEKAEERQVFRIMVHENFIYESGDNNLALIFLSSPFVLKPNIQTICMPRLRMLFPHRRCKVVGWGTRSYNKSAYSHYLKEVKLSMVDRDLCQAQLRVKFGPRFKLPASLICAGGETGLHITHGDGGAALFCALEDNPDRYEQAGIVSWSAGEDVPSTFTNLAMFMDWIKPHLGQVVSVPGNFQF